MNWLYTFISEDILYTLGWTLLHALWQGTLLAIVLSIGMFVLNKHSSQARYAVAITAMFTMLLVSAITFWVILPEQHESIPQFIFNTATEEVIDWEPALYQASTEENIFTLTENITFYFNSHLPLIVTIWLMGVLIFTLKMLGGLAYIQRIKTYKVKQAETFWQNKVLALSAQMGIKKVVRLMESAVVKVPIVVGHLKPVILIPVGTITGLPPEQLEAILAHELAHIARHDFLVNILQSVVEIIFFYHPGVWWISKVIREERENCCDDLAVEHNKDSLTFAKALAQLQEIHWQQPTLAIALNGKKSNLKSRIERLLDFSENTKNFKTTFQEGFFTAILLTIAILGFSFTLQQVTQQESELAADKEAIEMQTDENTLVPDSIKDKTTDNLKVSFTLEDGRYIFARLDSADNIIELFIEGVKIELADFDKNKSVVDEVKKHIANLKIEKATMQEQLANERLALQQLRAQEMQLNQQVREYEREQLVRLNRLQQENERRNAVLRRKQLEEEQMRKNMNQKELEHKNVLLKKLAIEEKQMMLQLQREINLAEKAVQEGKMSKAELQGKILEMEKQRLTFQAEALALSTEMEKIKYYSSRTAEMIAKQNEQEERAKELKRKAEIRSRTTRENVKRQATRKKSIRQVFIEKIVPTLVKDKIMESENDNIHFTITNQYLEFDKETLSPKLHKKYLKLLKKELNVSLEGDDNFMIHYHPSNSCD